VAYFINTNCDKNAQTHKRVRVKFFIFIFIYFLLFKQSLRYVREPLINVHVPIVLAASFDAQNGFNSLVHDSCVLQVQRLVRSIPIDFVYKILVYNKIA
jgi:hypothetical protein